MAQSAEVLASDLIVASQYNNLRKDAIDASLGHGHTGGTGEGKRLTGAVFNDNDPVSCPLSTGVLLFRGGVSSFDAMILVYGKDNASSGNIYLKVPNTAKNSLVDALWIDGAQDSPTVYFAGNLILQTNNTVDGYDISAMGGSVAGLRNAPLSSPARSLDTIYQNTSGKIRAVAVSVFCPVYGTIGGYSECYFDYGGGSPPGTIYASHYCDTDKTEVTSGGELFCLVAPNMYYRARRNYSGGGSPAVLNYWREQDLM